MMSGFGGMTDDDQSAGQQPPSQPAEGQPDPEDTTTPESNTGTTGTNPEAGSGTNPDAGSGTNPEAGSGAGGYSNIFQL